MTKQITLQMSETNAVDTFTVSEQFVKNWCDSCDNIDTQETTQQEVEDFEAVVDSVYATLTHEQKKQLFAEALDTFNSVQEFNKDTGYCYEVSARNALAMCISCSLTDYYAELPA